MIHYSVLIPQRDAADAVAGLLPRLRRVLAGLLLPYEMICIDDASAQPSARALAELLDTDGALRVLRFDEPRGTGAALTAGLAASAGDLVIALDPRAAASTRYIPHLIARLSQFDLVTARRERRLSDRLWQRVSRVPRLIAAEPQLQPAEELFWAARREAVAGLALPRGAFRILETIVARRGFRVCRLLLAEGLPPQGSPYRPGMVDRLAGFWLERRFEPHRASEIPRGDSDPSRPLPTRAISAPRRSVPEATFLPTEKSAGDST